MADHISQTRYDYKIAYTKAIRDGKIVQVAFEKCPLCYENRANLLCDECVNKGEYNHTQRPNSGRFCDKRQQLFDIRRERAELVEKFETKIEAKCRKEDKCTQIETTRKRIILLKKAIEEAKTKCSTERKALSVTRKKRRDQRDHLSYIEKVTIPYLQHQNCLVSTLDLHGAPLLRVQDVHQIPFDKDLDVRQLIPLAASRIPSRARNHSGSSVDGGRRGSFSGHQGSRRSSQTGLGFEGSGTDLKRPLPVLRHELYLYNQYLTTQRRAFIHRLSRRIFPIEEVCVPNTSNLEMSMATALQDASETAFIAGRWVHVDLKGENHSKIIESTLPEYSGQSSALGLYVMTSRHCTMNADKTPVGNQSYSIQSALGHTAMFLGMCSNICDIHLPRRCSFRELNDKMSEYDFCNFVWRLHQNIRHWAASQGTEPDELVDYMSLRNMLAVLDTDTLGRVSGFVPNFVMPVKADLCPLEYESEEEEGEAEAVGLDPELSKEWERVPSGLPSYEDARMAATAPTDASTTGALINAAASLTGNAAASLTGWFKSYYNK